MKYLKALKLLIIIISTFGLLYFLYSKYFIHINNKDIILSEEHEEYKRRPIDPGGIVIPNSNSLIYEKLNPGSTIESIVNLLPEPEVPIELVFKDNNENIETYDSIDDILAKLELPEVEKSSQNESSSLRSSSWNVGDNIMPSSINKESSTLSADKPEKNQNLKQIENIAVEGYKLKITKSEDDMKMYNLNKNSTDYLGYKIHLSTAWSEKEARNEWKKIQGRHNKYLKNAQLIIKKVKANNGRIIYLVMGGSYSTLNQAKLICKKLTLSQQNCIVTK